MALEASIVERLQELRKWQIDQEERLLKQQQEQRNLLSIEQERMYETLGLTMKDVIFDGSIIDDLSASKITNHMDKINDDDDDDTPDTPNISRQQTVNTKNYSSSYNDSNEKLHVPNVCLKSIDADLTISDSSNYKNLPQYNTQNVNDNDNIDVTHKQFNYSCIDTSLNGIVLLAPDKSLSRSILIDEIPVPSPKKDFTTLLEEKIRDDEAANFNTELKPKNQIKRPFLRKGEGLARFNKANPSSNKVTKPMRNRNNSRFTNSPRNKSQNTNKINENDKPKVNNRNKKIELSHKSTGTIANVAQQKMNLSKVVLPKKILRNNKSLPSSISSSILPLKINSPINKCITKDDMNQSDLDSSKLETKMFEMLEEKAENSSFCSTSSAVIAFMQQSTPLKLKSIRKNLTSHKQVLNHSADNINDDDLNHIVHTLKSNKLGESSVTEIHKKYSEKNIVVSKWDSGPFTNDNITQLNTNTSQKDIPSVVQPLNHSKIDDNPSNISTSTQIETIHENNYRNSPNNPADINIKNKKNQTESNLNMHVRFSEYNEYKTIGLTDTSTLSTDSRSAAVIYSNENNWCDHSESDEASDCEISLNEEIIDEKYQLNDTSKLLNPSANQYNHSLNREMKITCENNNNNTENSDENSIDQTTDDENSIFNDSDGTDYDQDTTISEIQDAMTKVSIDNNEKIKSVSVNTTKPSLQFNLSQPNDTIFKSDLLKNRLLELEKEIDIFRKENAALSLQRKKIEDEHRQLQREFKDKTDNLQRERNEMNIIIQEEKKRLAREKSALENRLRDARGKSIQSKHERQQIQILNAQLDELRDDIVEKESRWQAAQARQRSQIRVLQMENTKLKSEIEQLQSTKRINGKLKRPNIVSNTKAIHQINKQLDGKKSTVRNYNKSVSDDESDNIRVMNKEKCDSTAITSASTNRNLSSSSNVDSGKVIIYNSQIRQKPTIKTIEQTVLQKRYLYETLLKDAAHDYHERYDEESPIILNNNNDELTVLSENYKNKSDIDLIKKSTSNENDLITKRLSDSAFQHEDKLLYNHCDVKQCDSVKINDEMEEKIPINQSNDVECQKLIRGSYQQFVHDVINPKNDNNQMINSNSNGIINSGNLLNSKNSYDQLKYLSDDTKSQSDRVHTSSIFTKINKNTESYNGLIDNESVHVNKETINYKNDEIKFTPSSEADLTPRKEHDNPLPRPPDNMTPQLENIQVSQISELPISNKTNTLSSSTSSPSSLLAKHNIREVKHPDGHTEYWYPNGNVKRIYPDRNITKMIYYNGDVRETTPDGRVKYFYAATKTWHTTYPDGFELLEFPDGQQERRTKDGVIEVSFPDGSVRLMQPDGIEKWALTDGTIAEVFPNGEKILSLANGQREIHTTDHKRREYPDGTVKFVYSDGVQETRYGNGRIRIKDKDGNLVLDSYQS